MDDVNIENWKTEIRRGLIEMCILALLRRREMYGYEISKTLRQMTNGALYVEEGTLYPLLRRLENKGYIKGDWRIREGKARKYYELRPKGLIILKAMTDFWFKVSDAVYKVLGEVDNE